MDSSSTEMRLKSLYKRDREWGDSFESQVLSIFHTLLPHLAVIAIASEEKDNKYATDFEVKLVGGTIAVRLRRSNCGYRDLTIRARRDSGTKTELAKIKEGHAFRYFYGWTDDNNTISEWILVDLDKLRMTDLLDRRLIPNGDGTHFIAISVNELQDTSCLIASQLLKEVQVPLVTQPVLVAQKKLATVFDALGDFDFEE